MIIELILALLICACAAWFALAAGAKAAPVASVPVRDEPAARRSQPAGPALSSGPAAPRAAERDPAQASNGPPAAAQASAVVVLEPPPIPVPTRRVEPAPGREAASVTLAPTPAPTPPPEEHPALVQDLVPAPESIRLGRPQPRPDPARLIQTEVLEPEGLWERVLAASRLMAGVVVFGVLVGLSVIAFFRGIGFFFRKAFGG